MASIFSRDGFTDGYFTGNLSHMGGIRREEDKKSSRTEAEAIPTPAPLCLTGEAVIQRDAPATLSLSLVTRDGKTHTATAEGEIPLSAQTAALTRENVTQRLAKLGGTGFSLSALDLSLADGLFLPVGALNALRRDAVEKLIASLSKRQETPHSADAATQHMRRECSASLDADGATLPSHPRTAYITREDTFRAIGNRFDIAFVPFLTLSSFGAETDFPNGVALPPVLFDREEERIKPTLISFRKRGVKYALVGSTAALSLAIECGFLPFGDFRLNIANRESAHLWRSLGLCGFLASAECPTSLARRIGGSVISYGRIPLMLTERCFVKESFGCEACGRAVLTDRKGVSFPTQREYPHRTLVLNSLPTYAGDTGELDAPIGVHMIFTAETPKEAKAVLAAFETASALPFPVRRTFK